MVCFKIYNILSFSNVIIAEASRVWLHTDLVSMLRANYSQYIQSDGDTFTVKSTRTNVHMLNTADALDKLRQTLKSV
jgi:hypothetical protein